MSTNDSPFADLPAALVEEVLGQTKVVADSLLDSFQKIRADRNALREQLTKEQLVISESSLGYPPLPTTCGADGSYAIERLLTTDLVAAAAVAVEGLTPPSETGTGICRITRRSSQPSNITRTRQLCSVQ